MTSEKDERRLLRFMETAIELGVVLLSPDGIVAIWNDGAERILRCPRQAAIGHAFASFLAPADPDFGESDSHNAESLLAAARAEGRIDRELALRRRDGTRFWAALSLRATTDADGNFDGFAATLRDLTTPARPGTAAPGTEDRFRLLVQGVTDYALFMLDPQGLVSTWNPGAERLKRYAAEEIIGVDFARFYTEEDRRDGLPQRVLETARRDGRMEAQGWRVRKDGSRFWALAVIEAVRDEHGTLLGFAKITRDMTERRRAEQALQDSERRFRLLVQGVTDYAIFMLDPDGRVANWNSGAANIKGYASEEIVGQHFSRFYTEEDRAAGKPDRVLAEVRSNGRFAEDGWRVRKDGTRFYASVVIDAIRDEQGELVGFAKVTRDVTERHRLQAELDQAREQLFQAQRLEAIGNLTGGIAHDFNNLLTVIRGSVELADRRANDDPRLKSLLAAVQVAAGRAADLIQQLLAFSRRQPLRPELIDLHLRLQETAGFLDRSLRQDIGTVLDMPAGLWPVEVDPRQLELALLNIGLNARDAMPAGGTLRVSAENRTIEDPKLGLSGDFVRIVLADQGVGIPPELIERVIEPFFTTKEVGKGSGLGLSQAFGFARQSGGTLSIDSQLGEGTTVCLYLPARSRIEAPAAPPEPQPRDQPPLGAVLVVEDDPAVAELASIALEDLGYRVTLVTCARAALERLDRGEHFDLVFSDIIMPGGMNGVELAQHVRTRYPNMPVLLTSGYSEAAASENARRFPILTKPYQLTDLAQRVARMLARPH